MPQLYTPKVGASFVRNDDYWGEKALPARVEFLFFADIQPQILALQGGQGCRAKHRVLRARHQQAAPTPAVLPELPHFAGWTACARRQSQQARKRPQRRTVAPVRKRCVVGCALGAA